MGLEVEPELGLHVEEDAEGEGGLGGDGTAALDNLGNAGCGDACAAGECGLRDAHGVEEFLQENPAGCGIKPCLLFGCHVV